MKGSPAYIRQDVDFALKQLGVDFIDILVLCRVPTDVTIEQAVLGMKTLVNEEKHDILLCQKQMLKLFEEHMQWCPCGALNKNGVCGQETLKLTYLTHMQRART